MAVAVSDVSEGTVVGSIEDRFEDAVGTHIPAQPSQSGVAGLDAQLEPEGQGT